MVEAKLRVSVAASREETSKTKMRTATEVKTWERWLLR